jgi:hypothetical protein
MNVYTILVYSWYVFFALNKLGIWEESNEYLEKSEYYLKIYVGLVLLYYFNPFIKRDVSKVDKGVIFTGALYLILTSTFHEFFGRITSDTIKIKNKVIGISSNLLN